MKGPKENYQYLLRLYSIVDEYLANTTDEDSLPEVIVAFCTVTEKIFKIKLHAENPVLVYDMSKFKEDDALITVVKEKDLIVETIRIRETLNRYKLMFIEDFSEDEMQVLIDLYNIRNHFVHGYKADNGTLADKENIIRKMGTVWEKVSNQALIIFGKDSIKKSKPKKKYTEDELEEVITKEVEKKIESHGKRYGGVFPITMADLNLVTPLTVEWDQNNFYDSDYGFSIDKCPRCGLLGFAKERPSLSGIYNSRTLSDLYKCKKCHLELTQKEFDIAKKLKEHRK